MLRRLSHMGTSLRGWARHAGAPPTRSVRTGPLVMMALRTLVRPDCGTLAITEEAAGNFCHLTRYP